MNDTELEVLQSILGQMQAANSRLGNIQSYVDGVEGFLSDVIRLNTITNDKLDTIIGEVPDIRNNVEDVIFERFYVGDREDKAKREAKNLAERIAEGYRPYFSFGVSEDIARVAMVKYVDPNKAK